jgi:periplasmic divalent cation tolerance protein
MDLRLIYITTKDVDEARRIGRSLITERLVACVNIVDAIESLYWWKGEIVDSREAVVIAKTKTALVPAVIEKVKLLHGYECPCVVALPILEGNEDFLRWIENETVYSS